MIQRRVWLVVVLCCLVTACGTSFSTARRLRTASSPLSAPVCSTYTSDRISVQDELLLISPLVPLVGEHWTARLERGHDGAAALLLPFIVGHASPCGDDLMVGLMGTRRPRESRQVAARKIARGSRSP